MYPTYRALTPLSAFAASKFHFVLYNDGTAGRIVQIQLIVLLTDPTVVAAAASGLFNLQRRLAPGTPPSGAGGITPIGEDSQDVVDAGIGVWNAPAVAPATGTLQVLHPFFPQGDEAKVATLDAPTAESSYEFSGRILYDANRIRAVQGKPLVVRSAETLEIQQDATAGVGQIRILTLFTVRPR